MSHIRYRRHRNRNNNKKRKQNQSKQSNTDAKHHNQHDKHKPPYKQKSIYAEIGHHAISKVDLRKKFLFDAKITDSTLSWFQRTFPNMEFGYHKKHLLKQVSCHPGLRGLREMFRSIIYLEAMRSSPWLVSLDPGTGHKKLGHVVHCCQPPLSARDVLRTGPIQSNTVTKCNHTIEQCLIANCCRQDINNELFNIMMVHNVYYFTRDKLCLLYRLNNNLNEIHGVAHDFGSNQGTKSNPFFSSDENKEGEGYYHRGTKDSIKPKSSNITMTVKGDSILYQHDAADWLLNGPNTYSAHGVTIAWYILKRTDYCFQFKIKLVPNNIQPDLCVSQYKVKLKESEQQKLDTIIDSVAGKCAFTSTNEWSNGKCFALLKSGAKEADLKLSDEQIAEAFHRIAVRKDKILTEVRKSQALQSNNSDKYNAVIASRPVDSWSWFSRSIPIKDQMVNLLIKLYYKWTKLGPLQQLILLYMLYKSAPHILKWIWFNIKGYIIKPILRKIMSPVFNKRNKIKQNVNKAANRARHLFHKPSTLISSQTSAIIQCSKKIESENKNSRTSWLGSKFKSAMTTIGTYLLAMAMPVVLGKLTKSITSWVPDMSMFHNKAKVYKDIADYVAPTLNKQPQDIIYDVVRSIPRPSSASRVSKVVAATSPIFRSLMSKFNSKIKPTRQTMRSIRQIPPNIIDNLRINRTMAVHTQYSTAAAVYTIRPSIKRFKIFVLKHWTKLLWIYGFGLILKLLFSKNNKIKCVYHKKTKQQNYSAGRCHGIKAIEDFKYLIVKPTVTTTPRIPKEDEPYLSIPPEYFTRDCQHKIKPMYVSYGPRPPYDLVTGGTCIHNLVETAAKRVMWDVKADPKYKSNLDQKLMEEWQKWSLDFFDFYSHVEQVEMKSVEEYAEQLLPNKKLETLKHYRFLVTETDTNAFDHCWPAELFLKIEALCIAEFDKAVRAVNAPPPKLKPILGSFCKSFSKQLQKVYSDIYCIEGNYPDYSMFIYGSGYNKWQVGKIYERIYDYLSNYTDEPVHLVIDLSRYDLHYTHGTPEQASHFNYQFKIMCKLVKPNDAVISWMKQSWRVGNSGRGVTYKRNDMRLTGYNETAAGNTTNGIGAFAFTLHLTFPKLTMVELVKLPIKGLFLGDDADLITTPEIANKLYQTISNWYSKLGWSIKVELATNYTNSFCSMIAIPGYITKNGVESEGIMMINFPAKILLKFGWTKYAGSLPKRWKQLAYLQALCIGAKENDIIPFLKSYRNRILILIKDELSTIQMDSNKKFYNDFVRLSDYYKRKHEVEFKFIKSGFIDSTRPSPSTYSYIQNRYDMTRNEIDDLSYYFANIPDLHTVFDATAYPGCLINKLIEADLYSIKEYNDNYEIYHCNAF
jgi:hypothetical protein